MTHRNPQDRICRSIQRRHHGPALRGLCIAVVVVKVLVVDISVNADESETKVIATTRGTSYSVSAPAGWQASTRQDEPREKIPRPTSSLTIRAYEGFRTLRPFYGDIPAYGINITSEIEHCPDGNDRISALNIGGWFYKVDGDCSDHHRRSRITVSDGNGKNDAAISDESKPDDAVIHCDPATERCRIVDP